MGEKNESAGKYGHIIQLCALAHSLGLYIDVNADVFVVCDVFNGTDEKCTFLSDLEACLNAHLKQAVLSIVTKKSKHTKKCQVVPITRDLGQDFLEYTNFCDNCGKKTVHEVQKIVGREGVSMTCTVCYISREEL